MKFFRNPEIKKNLFFYLFLLALLTAAGFSHSFQAGWFLLFIGILYTFFHFFSTYRRYAKLEQLSRELDSILHNETPIHFEAYQEGELSILESELSKMTLRLSEQSAALLADKKLLADSMADISHQIRSPLTSAHLLLSLLAEPELSASRRKKLLQELSQLLSRIDWLIEALLKMSKMDAKTAYLQQVPVFLPELISNAAKPLIISMELREQTLSTHYETGTEHFTGDISWSTEAILNILKNCMEHTPSGGAIAVFCSENTIFTQIIIEDNGPGFSTEDLPHLFERFYKGQNSSDNSVGIGLALSRMIITSQNGTIKAENRPGGGARFTIKFYK